MHKEEETRKTLSSGIWSHLTWQKFTSVSEEPPVAIFKLARSWGSTFLQHFVKYHTHKKTASFIVAISISSNVAGRNMFYQ